MKFENPPVSIGQKLATALLVLVFSVVFAAGGWSLLFAAIVS